MLAGTLNETGDSNKLPSTVLENKRKKHLNIKIEPKKLYLCKLLRNNNF
jgi:hypothetical protein